MDYVLCDAVPEVLYVPVHYINISLFRITLNFWHLSNRQVIVLKMSTRYNKPLGSTNFETFFESMNFQWKWTLYIVISVGWLAL